MKIYIYIYILGGFPVAGMKKKMNEKKKNLIRSSWKGYCPFSVLSHDTIDCIVTQERRGLLGQAGHDQDTALRHGEERSRHGQGRLRYG